MKYTLILLPLLLLTGCLKTAPIKMSFPDVPQELKTSCPDLQQVKADAQMSDVLTVVTDNYSRYHECKNKVDVWIEWYKSQKQIYEDVK
jgi:hypothetical protein